MGNQQYKTALEGRKGELARRVRMEADDLEVLEKSGISYGRWFLVFRALLQAPMKTPPKEALSDPWLMRGRFVALELLKICWENAGACLGQVILAIFFLLCSTSFVSAQPGSIFNVINFGAVGDGKTDDSQAFTKAWNATCSAVGGTSTLLLPRGKTFLLKPIIFKGPCKSPSIHIQVIKETDYRIPPFLYNTFRVRVSGLFFLYCKRSNYGIHVQVLGDVAGPSTIPEWNKAPTWLDFHYVDNLTIDGTGRIGGQGSIWWPCKTNRNAVSNQPPFPLCIPSW
ncbi:hypothetical protein CKAN_01184800 [Cinnamomum micranthum f. kanehirae]|uniref:Polygalacturonase n=1 Tax=Cinnamomum micranthum f. kanehirae TaxID=337451 RepID=A0A443NX46_9MAGN|nr:hypothetical protein CKAN_01184800 [Cinnamomum micranthum f. kanehirae]